MTDITIDKDLNLSKNHFKDLEELQIELVLYQERFELTTEHKRILKRRVKEADNATDNGLSWEEVKANLC